ncbi:Uncharacterised protein [Bordetella pertussis]|nr:Uncharacterised protein [Bordetella pertussis]CFP60921.1 Uncharacterised protein [Bordetella pertussis]CFU07772.1 Uncharacterised protein [Bordetella pertussis]CFW42640.1 Uncharacterised protein [Bordetella pertussis]
MMPMKLKRSAEYLGPSCRMSPVRASTRTAWPASTAWPSLGVKPT